MKILLLVSSFLFCNVSIAQNDFSEEDAKEIITVFFEGFHQGDTLKMKSVMAENLQMQTVYVNKAGENKMAYLKVSDFLNAISDRPADQKWEEKLLAYSVGIDGNLAHVWTPYEFYVNDTFSHCGANSFTLANTDEGWKILHLIDSRRKESCGK